MHPYAGDAPVVSARDLTWVPSLGSIIDDYVDAQGLPDDLVELIYRSYVPRGGIPRGDVGVFMERVTQRLPISEAAFLYRYIEIPADPAHAERRRVFWWYRRL